MTTPTSKPGLSLSVKRAEERFRLVVEASPSAILMVNSEGCIALVNTQTETLFGYERAELLNQPVEMLVPDRYRAAHPGHRTGSLTSSREERDIVESYKLGVNSYVVKPVDFHQFVEAIKQVGSFWAVVNQPPPNRA
jgi:PAS domain-containing protein